MFAFAFHRSYQRFVNYLELPFLICFVYSDQQQNTIFWTSKSKKHFLLMFHCPWAQHKFSGPQSPTNAHDECVFDFHTNGRKWTIVSFHCACVTHMVVLANQKDSPVTGQSRFTYSHVRM